MSDLSPLDRVVIALNPMRRDANDLFTTVAGNMIIVRFNSAQDRLHHMANNQIVQVIQDALDGRSEIDTIALISPDDMPGYIMRFPVGLVTH